MDKLSFIDQKDFEKPIYINDMSGYNYFPTPWREISMHEFNHSWMWCIETRQIIDKEVIGTGCMLQVYIMYFHNEALAVSRPSKWHTGDDEFGVHGIIYEDKPRYFKIGCEHDYTHCNPHMFDHRYECKKCGHKYAVDSSG